MHKLWSTRKHEHNMQTLKYGDSNINKQSQPQNPTRDADADISGI